MNVPALLECRLLRIQAGRRILTDGLDWRVNKGELWCVLGPNGVGKSTLLHTLAGLLQPAAGSVAFDGKSLNEWSLGALAHARGLMAQQQVDAFSTSVLDTVLIGRTPFRVGGRVGQRRFYKASQQGSQPADACWDAQQDITVARAALEAVGMSAFADADILQLSGGERQRVALATLLAQAPGIMLLDEPTAHQDVAQQLNMMRLLQDLSSLHALVVTCHDINLAARFASHILLLAPTVVYSGTVDTVLTTTNLTQAYGCRFDRIALDPLRSGFIAS